MSEAAGPQLDLSFETRGSRTVLAHRHVSYPFFVTSPIRGRGLGAEVIVQSVSGGLFGDEKVTQRVDVDEGASVTMRMPSATIVHDRRAKGPPSLDVTLRIGSNARLQYLPRPLILFPGSALVQTISLTIGPGSTVLIQDGFLVHDPQGIPTTRRALDSRVAIRKTTGGLVALDRTRMTDVDIDTAAPGVTDRYRAFGTIWLLHDMSGGIDQILRSALSSMIVDSTFCYWAMTLLRRNDGVMIKIAARDGGDLDIGLTAIRNALASVVGDCERRQ
jgi:urease accessory protein